MINAHKTCADGIIVPEDGAILTYPWYYRLWPGFLQQSSPPAPVELQKYRKIYFDAYENQLSDSIKNKIRESLPGAVCRKVAEKREQSHLEKTEVFNVTAIRRVKRFHISSRWYLFLTDYEQSKAIAKVSQIRHKVHQNQKLRPKERERQEQQQSVNSPQQRVQM